MKSSFYIIDVDANIGDSVINIGLRDAKYLLIEGVSKYAKLIEHNLSFDYEYILKQVFLAENEEYTGAGYDIEVNAGTASIKKPKEKVICVFLH